MIDTFENIKKRKINNKTIIIIKKILKEDKKKINIDELVERFKLLNISLVVAWPIVPAPPITR